MLKMKNKCEKCEAALAAVDEAHICSFECTFCHTCTESMDHICPNCNGELVKRPTRKRKPLEVAASQLKGKLFGKKN